VWVVHDRNISDDTLTQEHDSGHATAWLFSSHTQEPLSSSDGAGALLSTIAGFVDDRRTQGFFDHVVQERNLAPASCRVYLNGVRFLYLKVLEWPSFDLDMVVPRRAQRIPELLTRAEVGRILAASRNPKHRMLLELAYGCGLRVSEVVDLRVRDIDGERGLLRIAQGKGAKDRMVTLPDTLLVHLRSYWTHCRPGAWLFPSSHAEDGPICLSTAQRVFTNAKCRAGIDKIGGIHSLRHAYATHRLEKGLPVHELQRLLRHNNLQSTERYLHWLPGRCDAQRGCSDLLADIGALR